MPLSSEPTKALTDVLATEVGPYTVGQYVVLGAVGLALVYGFRKAYEGVIGKNS